MNNILKAGLCTLLLGSTTLVSYKGPDAVHKNDLEMTIAQEVFVSPQGNYSLKTDPKKYGFIRSTHEVSPIGYWDTYYYDSKKWMILITGSEQKGDLDMLYDASVKNLIKSLADAYAQVYPDKRIDVAILPTVRKSLDGMPAIQGTVGFFDNASAESTTFTSEMLYLTVIKSDKMLYGIALLYHRNDYSITAGKEEAKAKSYYEEIVETFHALK